MTPLPERTARIVAMRHQGATLADMAAATGLTRERVRQLLAAEGLKAMTAADYLARAVEGWRASGELAHPSDIAKEYGLPDNATIRAKLRRACPDLTMPTVAPHRSRWDAPAIADILARIAKEQGIDLDTGWMTVGDYAAWKSEDDPSTATIGSNYLWGHVMELAGFNPANATKRGRALGEQHHEFTDAELDTAVLMYLDSSPAKLSAAGMDRFLLNHPEQPSIATIRNRFRRRGIGSLSGIYGDVLARCRPE